MRVDHNMLRNKYLPRKGWCKSDRPHEDGVLTLNLYYVRSADIMPLPKGLSLYRTADAAMLPPTADAMEFAGLP